LRRLLLLLLRLLLRRLLLLLLRLLLRRLLLLLLRLLLRRLLLLLTVGLGGCWVVDFALKWWRLLVAR
jgi:hypothetical protein